MAITKLLEALDWHPLVPKDEPERERPLDFLGVALRNSLASMFSDLWGAVRAVDVVLAEVADQFDGADALRPEKRQAFEVLRSRLLGLAEQLLYLDVEIELEQELDEELVVLLRKMVKLD